MHQTFGLSGLSRHAWGYRSYVFPALGAYVSGSEFQYPDLTWKELCGQMAHLVADSGMGKDQLTACVETIMRKRRQHDEEELQKLVEWQKTVKTKVANKEKLGGGIVTCHVNAPVSLSQYAPIAGAHGGAPLQLRWSFSVFFRAFLCWFLARITRI